ncbi:MAG: hypothetical protein MZV64_71520 [Ignavibacteriales bacterium]|nr:hypothetical protein [Ignavibacteriales bacterium]
MARRKKKNTQGAGTTSLFFEMQYWAPAIPVIEGKLQFTKDVLKLGYLAPKSVLVKLSGQSARSQLADIGGL